MSALILSSHPPPCFWVSLKEPSSNLQQILPAKYLLNVLYQQAVRAEQTLALVVGVKWLSCL
jgi:hypothetical protein